MHLRYCGIRVTDMDRSVRFYTEAVGLQQVHRKFMKHGGEFTLLEDPESKQRLELNYYPEDNAYYTPFTQGEGFDHLGLRVDDAREAYEKFLKAGAEPAVEPWEEEPGMWVGYVKGPDGEWLELASWG